MAIQAFVATYGAVLVAEIAGDKLLYTSGVLATRFRPAPMMCGLALAFMAKMGAAVIVGDAVGALPRAPLAALTAAGFLWMASRLWRGPAQEEARGPARGGAPAALVSFASVFFAEWADLGQLTAAAMAAQFHRPILVWSAAVLAMLTKTAVAVTLGASARRWIQRHLPPAAVRYGGAGALLLVGALTVAETWWR